MGYFIRLLTPSTHVPSLGQLQDDLDELGFDGVTFAVEDSDADDTKVAWRFLRVFDEDGYPVCDISRDVLGEGDMVQEELADFRAELKDALPKNAARWAREQLEQVKSIYAVQILATDSDDDESEDSLPSVLLALLQGYLGGMIQGDGEGFSNDDGALVVWQFSDDAQGEWLAAVMDGQGSWTPFMMDIGEPAHRAAFQEGRVPVGATLVSEDEDDDD
ncbi:MAG: hypothetical protein ACOYKM_11260 [Caulobacterales bacterium]